LRLIRIAAVTLLACWTLPSQQQPGGITVDMIWSARYVVTEDIQRRVSGSST
jgi:hypothetical protein